jgi:hypothetical protein
MATLNVIYKIAADISSLESGVRKGVESLNRIESAASKVNTRMVAFGSAIGSFAGSLAKDVFKEIARDIGEIALNGVRLAPIVGSFNSLTAAVGQSGQAMLAAARSGTKGLISDLELMQAANKGLLLGLPITAQSFGLLSQTAVVLGKAMGQGPVKSFDDLITALGRSSPLILDNLGLSVKVGEANEKYARSIGKTADSLTDAEKKLAFYNAAMDAARDKVEAVGGLQLTLADRVVQAKVAFTNFTDALGVAIATSPVINEAFGAVADALAGAFGENQTVLVIRLMGVVNDLAIGLVDVASVATSTAKYITEGFYLVRGVLFGVMEAVANLVYTFLKANASIAEFAASMPGVGSQFAGMALDARRAADVAGSVAASFKRTKEEAFDTMGTAGAAFDAAGASLDAMRTRMVAASKQGADAAAIAARLSKGNDDIAGSTKKASDEAERFAKAWANYTSTAATWVATLQTMNGAVVEAVKWDLAHGKSKSDLSVIYRLTSGQIDAVASALEFEALVAKGSAGIHATLAREVWNVETALGKLFARPLDYLSILPKLKPGAWIEALIPKGLGASLRDGLSGVLQGIPQTLANAFTGGGGFGGAVQSIATQLGSTLGSTIGKTIGMLGSFGGPIGAAIGSLAGPLVGLFGKLFDNPEKKVNPIRQAFVDAAGGLDQLNRRAHAAGVTLNAVLDAKTPEQYKKAIEDLTAAFEFQDNAMRTLDATVKKYGFTIEELGPALQRQNLDKQAQELFQDFKVLTAAGIGIDTVLARMGDSINAFVADALKTGTEIPAAMAPMLQRMVEMGTLVDANGNVITDLEAAGVKFALTMSEGFQALIGEVQKLTEAITRGLGLAIETIPDPSITGTVRWHVEPPPNIPRGINLDGSLDYDGDPVTPMANGGVGTVNEPTLFLAGEAGPEQFAFSGANRKFGDVGGGGGVTVGSITVHLSAPDGANKEQLAATLKEVLRTDATVYEAIGTIAERRVA